jgi:hypothetical protein
VGADDHGHALGGLVRQPAPDLVPGHGVEAGGRLVEQQQPGQVDHARGELEPSRPAPGQPPRGHPGVLGQVELVEGGLGDRSRSAGAVDLGTESQILQDGELGIE